MRVTRRHHFLPQGYLAGFTDTGRKDGLLHVVDIGTQRSFKTSPLNVAVERDFKRVDIEGHPPDAIEAALAPIEDRAIQAIRRVAERRKFPDDVDHNLLLNLLSLVMVQNPKSRRALNEFRTHEADGVLRKMVSSRTEWERQVSAARAAGADLDKDEGVFDEARRFVEERRYRIAFDQEGTLRAEFDLQDELLSLLGKRSWTLLLAPEHGPYFISSDYPFSLAMEPGVTGLAGLDMDNTELLFPLTKTAAFIGILGRPLARVVEVPSKVVAIMNRRLQQRADRRLFLSHGTFLTYELGTTVEVTGLRAATVQSP